MWPTPLWTFVSAGLRYSQRASDKLFADAAREEAQQGARRPRLSMDPQDPVWTGDERLEDTVLRMLMDKYKPLRQQVSMRAAESSRLRQSQKPTLRPTESRRETAPKTPYTPPGQPWNAVFVRPSHAAAEEPRVYRGKYMDVSPPKSDMAQHLARKGIAPSQLALDDRKAMSELRHALRRSMHRDKIEVARDIKLGHHAPMPSEESAPQIGMLGATKGLAGIAEQRIVEAQAKGLFRSNPLHGKPMPRDYNETNPFLHREEFVLNRMIQRQGNVPPWVQRNQDLQTEMRSLQQRIQHAWICRMLYRLDASEEWGSLAPVHVHWHDHLGPDDLRSYRIEARSEAEQRTLEWVRTFRDAAWIAAESAYHTAAVDQLNQVIRSYNHTAPPSARKVLVTKDAFLASSIQRAFPLMVDAASARIRARREMPRKARTDTPRWPRWLW